VTAQEIIDGVRAGTRRHIGRAISLAESGSADGRQVLAALHPATGRALRVGLTGPPGVGKSSLVSALVGLLRADGQTVAVVSVDPSSPFTRGAVLGDRIRLAEHFVDPGVFIRSMATRGHLGGLSEATADAVLILDSAGYDVILVETVGAGQNEIEVQALTETVVLALMPGSGDSIQAIKAGLMEIPDVIVVNKADRPGADLLRAEIESALTLVPGGPWKPPIVETVAIEGRGTRELWETVTAHRAFLDTDGRLDARRRDGLARQLRQVALDRVARAIEAKVPPEALAQIVERVMAREIDPATAADQLTGPLRRDSS
jgi:LAO/AO transport system kinase